MAYKYNISGCRAGALIRKKCPNNVETPLVSHMIFVVYLLAVDHALSSFLNKDFMGGV